MALPEEPVDLNQFTPDQNQRWASWQQANAIATVRTDYIVRLFALSMFAALLSNLAISMWS